LIFSHAFRAWRNAKGVAVLAAAALAVGIGSTTAIYTVVSAVMLKPLPYRDGDRFVALFGAAVNDPEHYGSLLRTDAETYHQQTTSFDAFGWFREAGKNLTFNGTPHHVDGIAMTIALAPELGVQPALGQWFRDERGVVLSSALWRLLGADPGIVGKPLTLDGRAYVVSGVMPEVFRLPVAGITWAGFRADLWMPLDPTGRGEPAEDYFVYARRKPGVTFAVAEADVKRVAAEIAAADPVRRQFYTARLFDLRETAIKNVRPTLVLLFAAAGLLFLITCANAAGLLLARSVARARETAVRVALGAGRGRLASHYFLEGLLVSLAGAVGGVVLSVTLTPAIVSLAADYLPRAHEISVNWTVLLFALGAAMAASALSSLAPLWQAAQTAPADVLGEGVRATAGARSRRLSRSLVVAEIALAFGLLAVSAALILHLRNLSRVSPGFDADQVLTFVVSIPGTIAGNRATRVHHQQRLLEAVDAIPGTDEVAFANQLPLDGCCFGATMYADGRPVDPLASQRSSLMGITPGYFRAMRIPLRTGRTLTDRDLAVDPILAVINQAAADQYWRGADPVGAYGRFNDPVSGSRFQVIGVVGDVKNEGLASPTVPEIYLLSVILQIESMNFVVRSARDPASLMPEIRRAVQRIDPEQPVADIATMRQIMHRTMTLERVASVMTAFFAGAALLMAVLGVYGVVSYSVRQRTVEIGTRMALGATTRGVLALIAGGGLAMAAYGVLAGGAASIGGVFYLDRVFRIGEIGPAPFLYSTAIVAVMTLAASSLPAWRATLLSPMVAIRNEPGSLWRVARAKAGDAMRDVARAGGERAPVPIGALISEFAEAVRRAASFADAVQVALAALRERVGARSITLLEKGPGGEFRSELWTVPAKGFLLNRLRHYPHPVSLTPADFEAWRRWAGEYRSEYAAEIEALGQTDARLAVPLRTKTEIVGVLLLGPPLEAERYSSAEKQVLGSAADVFALMIENARLTERALEQDRIRRDLALAAEVQRRLLPPQPPTSRTATLAAFTLPARTVGGDYYDFLDLGQERIGIAVADIAGKGIAAALLMSVVQASLRVIASERDLPVSELAVRMNAFLHQSTGANKYATFFYAQVDAAGRRLRYVNAGHNPPFLVRRSGDTVTVLELGVGGTVLGLFPDVAYDSTEIDLCPGDLLVAFTDGVTEALNAAGEEFGEERLKTLLGEATGPGAEEVAATLAARMRAWIGGAEQHDDLTYVVMAVR
jgi:putative ABC transport system permease protein